LLHKIELTLPKLVNIHRFGQIELLLLPKIPNLNPQIIVVSKINHDLVEGTDILTVERI
jgi:hypothetical protein